jgi:hypothetical protein
MRPVLSYLLVLTLLLAPTLADAAPASPKRSTIIPDPYAVPEYDDDDLRAALVFILHQLGVSLDWDRYSASRL